MGLSERKKNIIKYIAAGMVGLAVIAFATIVAVVSAPQEVVPTNNSANVTTNNNNNNNNNEVVEVSNKVSFVLPMHNATISKDYSATELQYNETLKQWEIHKAIDFLAGDDLNVFSISTGVVSNVYNNYLEGNVVEITHSDGLVSVYKSLSDIVVRPGDKVTTGQLLGKASVTMAEEQTTGAHLHFEMYENNKKIDPANYLDMGVK